MTDALERLAAAVAGRRSKAASQAAIDVIQSTLDLRLRYRAPVAIDAERFVVWTRQLLLDARSRDREAVRGDAATLEWIGDRFIGTLASAGRREVVTRLRDLRLAAEAGDLPAAGDHAARLAARVRVLVGQ